LIAFLIDDTRPVFTRRSYHRTPGERLKGVGGESTVVMSLPTGSHLSGFLDGDPDDSLSLAVVGDRRPQPTDRMLRSLFERQPIEFVTATDEAEAHHDADASAEYDRVLLLRDGEVVARSPLDALERTILHVNSDLYITGAVGIEEIDLPDVIGALTDTTFHVRGFPESNSEKLPLILISRYIERLSADHGGTHRASFQRLSRIRDERGTENVYRTLGTGAADVHVYGVPDWLPPRGSRLKIHAGYAVDHEHTWFVLHRSEARTAALVAIEVDPNEWLGAWTFDRGRVTAIEAEIKEYL
jgi:hypothetical protein